MKVRSIIIFCTLSLGLINNSCKEDKRCTNEDKTKTDIIYNKIKYTKHELTGFDSSGSGKLILNKDKLLFADELFKVIYECDLEGHFQKILAERGKGPRDIIGCAYFIKNKDGYILASKNWVVCEMTKNWERKNAYSLMFPKIHPYNELRNNPSTEYTGIYEFDIYCKNICEYDSDHLLIPITTEHYKLNGYGNNSDEYYKNSYILGVVDREKGIVEKMIGHRSNVYSNKKYIPNFNWYSFTKIKDEIFVSFAADPKIQVMDKNGYNLYQFGIPGKNMKTNYRLTTNPQIAIYNTKEDLDIYDYYKNLKYIQETKLLFRTYKKNLKDCDGMQVYRNTCLIADINVPKDFRIIGYINGEYYAQGKIEDDIITYFNFKLE